MIEREIQRQIGRQIDRKKNRSNYRSEMVVDIDQTKQMTCSSKYRVMVVLRVGLKQTLSDRPKATQW